MPKVRKHWVDVTQRALSYNSRKPCFMFQFNDITFDKQLNNLSSLCINVSHMVVVCSIISKQILCILCETIVRYRFLLIVWLRFITEFDIICVF